MAKKRHWAKSTDGVLIYAGTSRASARRKARNAAKNGWIGKPAEYGTEDAESGRIEREGAFVREGNRIIEIN